MIKKKFACNGTIVSDSEMGEVIQLQGDQRKDIQDFLTDKKEGLGLDAKTIKVSHARHISAQAGVLIEYRSTVSKRYHVRASSYRDPLQIGLRGNQASLLTRFSATFYRGCHGRSGTTCRLGWRLRDRSQRAPDVEIASCVHDDTNGGLRVFII